MIVRFIVSAACVLTLTGMSGCETIRSEGNDPEKYEFGDATRALIHSGPELRHALSLYCDPETDIIVKRVAIKLLQTYIPYPDEGLCILVEPGLFFGETEIEITE